MVILNRLPFRDTLDMATMIEYDTKKEIQEHAKLINVSMPSSGSALSDGRIQNRL